MFGTHINLWETDSNEDCVKKQTALGAMNGINTLVGSQADTSTLEKWIDISGGKFDVILDDGGHHNHEILTTFDTLFHKALSPGGYYFIEDLQVGRYACTPPLLSYYIPIHLLYTLYNIHYIYTYTLYTIHFIYRNSGYTTNNESVADVITAWIDQLLIPEKEFKAPLYDYTNILNIRYEYPTTIKWIFGQQEACVIKKNEV